MRLSSPLIRCGRALICVYDRLTVGWHRRTRNHRIVDGYSADNIDQRTRTIDLTCECSRRFRIRYAAL